MQLKLVIVLFARKQIKGGSSGSSMPWSESAITALRTSHPPVIESGFPLSDFWEHNRNGSKN
eukprot:6604912-Prorocentrum_lima.AAC.1